MSPARTRIIPVLDLKGGVAVHAKQGRREHYRPVRSVLHGDSEPYGLAVAYLLHLQGDEIYIADLDAIAGGPCHSDLYRRLIDRGARLWLDLGLNGPSDLDGWMIESDRISIVAGLETLGGPEAWDALVRLVGPDRAVFGLDLRAGRPLRDTLPDWGTDDPAALARRAAAGGGRRLLALDLARVGADAGVGTVPLLRRIAAEFPGLELAAGGGVSGPDDLAELGGAGVSAVLVGSALHDGRLGARRVGPDG